MTIITIDGNIGCGKSHILNHLHRNYKLPIDLEPVESWNNYLVQLYENQNNLFKFQIRIWLDRCWIQEKSEKTSILIERSPYFIKNTFIKVALDQNLITEDEYNMLISLHKKTDHLWSCNKYIYLRSMPENCLKRIKKRNRTAEKNITLEYIQALHELHEKTFDNACQNKMNIIVINVDNKGVSEIAEEILQHFELV